MELIETMLFDKEIKNFKFHVNRVKKTFDYYKWKFNQNEWENLKNLDFKNRSRIRVTYNQYGIKKIETFEIKKRSFKSFKVVEIEFDYFTKKKKRDNFLKLHSNFNVDEFILIKNSLVTDTTISNLAFFDGNEWLTPKYPLLRGTKREEMILKGVLKEANIHKYDLKYFKKIAMINAIVGFMEIDNFDIIL